MVRTLVVVCTEVDLDILECVYSIVVIHVLINFL